MVEFRRLMLRHRISRDEMSKRLSMKTTEFSRLLEEGGETTVGMDEALRSFVLAEEVLEESLEEDVVSEEGVEEEPGTRRCVMSRRVPNVRLLMIRFSDGSEGRVLKKQNFLPKPGMEFEVEGGDNGFWNLVGAYRNDGRRLS